MAAADLAPLDERQSIECFNTKRSLTDESLRQRRPGRRAGIDKLFLFSLALSRSGCSFALAFPLSLLLSQPDPLSFAISFSLPFLFPLAFSSLALLFTLPRLAARILWRWARQSLALLHKQFHIGTSLDLLNNGPTIADSYLNLLKVPAQRVAPLRLIHNGRGLSRNGILLVLVLRAAVPVILAFCPRKNFI